MDDSRSAEELQPETADPSDLAEPAEADPPAGEPEPPRDDYVPV